MQVDLLLNLKWNLILRGIFDITSNCVGTVGNVLDVLLIVWEGALSGPSQTINSRLEPYPCLIAW
jgi:hypothetical protein